MGSVQPAAPTPSTVSVVIRLKPTDPNEAFKATSRSVTVANPRAHSVASGLPAMGTTDVAAWAQTSAGLPSYNVDNTKEAFAFSYERVLDGSVSQSGVFDTCARDLLDSFLGGISGCLLAYGQTGAGKTHTMSGPGSSFAERGLIPRAVSYCMAAVAASKAKAAAAGAGGSNDAPPEPPLMRVSYLEIYQEQLFDLLAAAPLPGAAAEEASERGEAAGAFESAVASARAESAGRGGTRNLSSTSTALSSLPSIRAPPTVAFSGFIAPKPLHRGPSGALPASVALPPAGQPPPPPNQPTLTVAEDAKTGRVYVKGLSCPVVASEAEALHLYFAGEANRAIAEHALNKASSRSHCVFTLTLEQWVRDTSSSAATEGGAGWVRLVSRMHLVDLAGSERVDKTGVEGAVRKEAQHINKSLAILEQVVLALTQKNRDHVPFRSSKLTHVLSDGIGGRCRTRLIAAVWPDPAHLHESLSTLRFAARMAGVVTTPGLEVVGRARGGGGGSGADGDGSSGAAAGNGGGGGSFSSAERSALVASYEAEIAALRGELALREALAGGGALRGGMSPASEDDVARVRGAVAAFLDGTAAATAPLTKLQGDDDTFGGADAFAAALPVAGLGSLRDVSLAFTLLRETFWARLADAKAAAPAVAAASSAVVGAETVVSTAAAPTEVSVTTAPAPAASSASQTHQAAAAAQSKAAAQRFDPSDPAARTAALEAWRGPGGAGAALAASHARAKDNLKARRAAAAAAATAVNEAKRRIDAATASLAAAEAGETAPPPPPPPSEGDEAAPAPAPAASPDLSALRAAVSEAKAAYKTAHATLQEAKSDAVYLQTVVDEAAAAVATAFQTHWAALVEGAAGTGAGAAPPTTAAASAVAAAANSDAAGEAAFAAALQSAAATVAAAVATLEPAAATSASGVVGSISAGSPTRPRRPGLDVNANTVGGSGAPISPLAKLTAAASPSRGAAAGVPALL